MRKIVTTVFLTLLSTSVFADNTSLVNSDGSSATEICIAAAKSNKALKDKAKELNFSKTALSKFKCNGLSLADFAKEFAIKKSDNSNSVKVFSFDNSIDSVEAEICIAAATSNERFDKLKSGLMKSNSYYNSIMCNKMPLSEFAKKHGNPEFNN